MTEHGGHGHHQPADVPRRPGEVHTPDAVQYDRDLNVRGVVWSALALAVGTLVVLVLMWWLFGGLGRLEKASDPPPPALREVRERHLPPEPRLQAEADGDMLELRAAEDQMIERPAWIDRNQGTVRIPIDLAIDVLLRRGLPAANGDPTRPPGSPTTPLPPVSPVPTANAPGTAAAAPPSPRGGGQ
jgi:hypothetical protein